MTAPDHMCSIAKREWQSRNVNGRKQSCHGVAGVTHGCHDLVFSTVNRIIPPDTFGAMHAGYPIRANPEERRGFVPRVIRLRRKWSSSGTRSAEPGYMRAETGEPR